MPVQDFKTKEPLSKQKSSFSVSLFAHMKFGKVGENAITAFCIVADDIEVTCSSNKWV